MRSIHSVVTAVTLCSTLSFALCLTSVPLLAQRQVQLLATVTDPGGAGITTLEPADIRVTENGTALTVVKIEPVDRVPKVQILIDNGVGMPSTSIGDLRNGVRDLLKALPPGLEITLVTTAPQPRLLEPTTTDRDKLLRAVDRITPDVGGGQFVESLEEATSRIDKDKQADAAYTIVTVGTTSGDRNAREGDIKNIMDRVLRHHTTVHAVILTSGVGATSGGVQLDVAEQVAHLSGGRYESIAVTSRVATLLPEIGAQMAGTLGASSRQFRVTAERQASGDLGQLGMGAANGRIVSGVSVERR